MEFDPPHLWAGSSLSTLLWTVRSWLCVRNFSVLEFHGDFKFYLNRKVKFSCSIKTESADFAVICQVEMTVRTSIPSLWTRVWMAGWDSA